MLKNRFLLENYYLPSDLKASIGWFVDHYNHRRHHETLSNLTSADAYFGRGHTINPAGKRMDQTNTIKNRRLQNKRKPHKLNADELVDPDAHTAICLKLSDDGQNRSTIFPIRLMLSAKSP